VQRHTGYDDDTVRQIVAFDYHEAPPFLGDLPALAPIQALVGIGDFEQARARYSLLAPPTSWSAPPFLRFTMTVLRVDLAAALGRHDDLPELVAVLEKHRGLHAGPTAGGVVYLGCAELWLGVARLALGEHDAAIADLRQALDTAVAAGTRPVAVQTAAQLASALAARGDPDDHHEAGTLAGTWRPEAISLRLAPWVERFDTIAAPSATNAGPLSTRELEVAQLVTRGLTNKQIAAELFVSERTAQNHVQHILTKLAVNNRTQIAAWYNQR
jgi:DNA-binding CsgD family transcriptional regulator